ncbi:SGNH/GDSL hydrolase family protein [Pedobacter sp. MC2016-24]|uniref:SGNH/GDSL hydrolase family protein n=1 Tax=Pedobacter sp. MC2016-24 TaxID=2780090 RepID=UPI00187E73AF|nr:SGNH/GDSL hydrolase family protein [Pedobacter sp. MC2016-24]MBE9599258.1 SGNH/GDSL hydrolase family protein [Pedobacter sp. MC2016-24]
MKKLLFLLPLLLLFTSFSGQQVLWTAIGDSITYMNEHPEETQNRISKGYMTMVTEKLPAVKYINQGHNGWTAGGIAEKIEKLDLKKSDIYSVFLGTNDWWHGRTIGTLADYTNGKGNETFYASYRIIINKLRELNPKAEIILMTPMQRGDFVYIKNAKNNAYGSYKPKDGQSLAQFANAVKEIAEYEKLKVVDLYNEKKLAVKHVVKYKRLKDTKTGFYKNFSYPAYIGLPFDPLKDEYPYPVEAGAMTYDGLHPSDQGYNIISKLMIKAIKPIL